MLYDLSIVISPDIVRYDDATPRPEFEPFTSIKAGDVNNQMQVTLFTHGGTHVDAPYHFCETGDSIDKININDFFYNKALIIDVRSDKGGRIGRERIEQEKGIEEADILMLYTGYSRYLHDEMIYRDDFPALTEEAALFLREKLPHLKEISLDTLSVDGVDGVSTGFANHHALLDKRPDNIRPLLIFECANFTPVVGVKGFFKAYGIPLRLKRGDASPVTLVAEVQ